ncbi:hypothetical protein [Streptomyces sp. NBC_00847]|uniref:hypothetical protein n=1 Tax=Streptomyces sp. NBC_00847 TaxID=2975850 RepID=UPI00224D583A|nr:hypothetical protein [Streptomyces sp. NBC_00847]MCX4883770.1 hypothetical protein [Streptomyces sp. NBC_00847]
MAHFTHPQELRPPVVRDAMRRMRGTGAVIRCQGPLVAGINDSSDAWAELWDETTTRRVPGGSETYEPTRFTVASDELHALTSRVPAAVLASSARVRRSATPQERPVQWLGRPLFGALCPAAAGHCRPLPGRVTVPYRRSPDRACSGVAVRQRLSDAQCDTRQTCSPVRVLRRCFCFSELSLRVVL